MDPSTPLLFGPSFLRSFVPSFLRSFVPLFLRFPSNSIAGKGCGVDGR